MNNNKTTPALIHATLALNASTSAPYYDINITQQLCQCSCADDKPVFDPKFSTLSVEVVGTNQYLVNILVEGVVNYIPCGCGSCCTKQQIISQEFSIPVYSTAVITGVTITKGASQNYIARSSCANCSKTFVSDTPVTITFITA